MKVKIQFGKDTEPKPKTFSFKEAIQKEGVYDVPDGRKLVVLKNGKTTSILGLSHSFIFPVNPTDNGWNEDMSEYTLSKVPVGIVFSN